MSLINDFLAVPLLAHTLPGDAGAIDGFLHPLLGVEHLLAMFAVGLLSAKIGGRAIWTVPTAFVVVMAVGGILGYFGETLPVVSYGIALSVLLLGGALIFQRRIPEAIALILVGLFALFHGYAHGEAVPAEQTFVFFLAYVLGFLVSTAGLHVIGALVGYIALRSKRGTAILGVSGALIAVIGVVFLVNLINVPA
ncbi:MAG: HupE/UreJ family protein [Chloroflexi bacterium]|nr:HupE/UreJ family protein [Chloroflexota bacterium]